MGQKGLAPILIIILITLGIGGYFIYQKQLNPKAYLTAQPSPSPTVPTDWKIYTNPKLELELKYPTNWTIKDVQKPSDVIDEEIELKGPEGEIAIVAWNEGYGGGCDPGDYVGVNIFGQTQDACHGIDKDGIESWNGMTKKLPTGYVMSINASANPPSQKNRDVVLQLLSIFKSQP